MNINSPHLPKQAKPLLDGQAKVTTYETSGGKVTAQFAAQNLSRIPPIPAGSIVHDNASGAGTVTRAILSSSEHASDITIHATDADPVFLDALQSDATKQHWRVEVSQHKSEALPFADAFFTHSITNIAVFFTSSAGRDGAREIYRTLRPGGTAVVNCWGKVPWFLPMKQVHDALRPGAPFPAPTINWSDGKQLRKVMLEAGFKEDTAFELEEREVPVRIPEADFMGFAEKTWAFLGGVGVWQASDEERWDEAVELLAEKIRSLPATEVRDGNVCMTASQWVVVARK